MADDSKIVISHNYSRLSALLRGLGSKKDVQKAVARSIKRTLTTMRKTAVQEIRAKKLIKLKASEAKQRIHAYDEAKPGKPVENQYGKIWIGSRAESLGHFYARRVAAGRSKVLMKQNKYGGWNGVRLFNVKLNSYGAPYLRNPEKSFVVQKRGGPVVFQRVGNKRVPIEKQKGPGMAELVQQAGIMGRLRAVAQERYAREFETNVRFYADRAIQRALQAKASAR